ncbi:MAG: type III pantothenate kinase [Actinomycetota bacterium]|nr:type III pantothenate kinase [Actinomycetota bacterium]
MLLVADVGNTQSSFGVFEGDDLKESWRISTNKDETADEVGAAIFSLLSMKKMGLDELDAMIISSVVPHCTASLIEMGQKLLGVEPLVVGPGLKTGVTILYDNPHEIGADRIVNAAAAHRIYGGPVIVVDFGTATTFDAISEKGEYLGGAIVPGIETSAEALFEMAARLSRVDLKVPKKAVGKNTTESLQSGILYGAAGAVDRIAEMIKDEIGKEAKVVATGGLAELAFEISTTIDELNPDLTLFGLKILFDKNV